MLRAEPTGERTVYVALVEDLYETRVGDGEFHYLSAVFLRRDEAGRRVREMQSEWTRGHLREVTLRLDGDRIVFPAFDRRLYDEYTPEQVLKAVEVVLCRLKE